MTARWGLALCLLLPIACLATSPTNTVESQVLEVTGADGPSSIWYVHELADRRGAVTHENRMPGEVNKELGSYMTEDAPA